MPVPPSQAILADSRLDWPGWFFALWILGAVLALISIWRGRRHSPRAKIIWTVVTILLPILGALAWFALGHERKR
jgi:hypothetical protein